MVTSVWVSSANQVMSFDEQLVFVETQRPLDGANATAPPAVDFRHRHGLTTPAGNVLVAVDQVSAGNNGLGTYLPLGQAATRTQNFYPRPSAINITIGNVTALSETKFFVMLSVAIDGTAVWLVDGGVWTPVTTSDAAVQAAVMPACWDPVAGVLYFVRRDGTHLYEIWSIVVATGVLALIRTYTGDHAQPVSLCGRPSSTGLIVIFGIDRIEYITTAGVDASTFAENGTFLPNHIKYYVNYSDRVVAYLNGATPSSPIYVDPIYGSVREMPTDPLHATMSPDGTKLFIVAEAAHRGRTGNTDPRLGLYDGVIWVFDMVARVITAQLTTLPGFTSGFDSTSYRTGQIWTIGVFVLVAPPLRLFQRDDGVGPARHPRLNVTSQAANQPTSVQSARMKRLGQSNTYL